MSLLGGSWLAFGSNRLAPSRGFPSPITDQLLGTALSGATLKRFVLNPDNPTGWAAFYDATPWRSAGFPADVTAKIGELERANYVIRSVVFNPGDAGGWIILCEDGAYVANGKFAPDVFAKLGELTKAGLVVQEVVFHPTNAGVWLIICRNNGWFASPGFPAAAMQQIGALIHAGNTCERFVFTDDDARGFVVICRNNVWVANGAPDILYQALRGDTTGGMILRDLVMTLAPFVRETRIVTSDAQLQDGDILLFVPSDLTGRIIDGLSGSNGYSHAGLVCGDQMIDVDNTVNATNPQCESVPLARSLGRKHVAVRIGLSALQAFKLCAWARTQLGIGENWAGLLTDGHVNQSNADICTMLIMHGLDAIGFDRAAVGLGGFVSPNHIARTFHAPPGSSL